MRATDGETGKVEDFYFDDNTLDTLYMVVKTGSWLFWPLVAHFFGSITIIDL